MGKRKRAGNDALGIVAQQASLNATESRAEVNFIQKEVAKATSKFANIPPNQEDRLLRAEAEMKDATTALRGAQKDHRANKIAERNAKRAKKSLKF